MQNFIASEVPVGRWLADQLLLPMALAGTGSFMTMIPDDHVPANISITEKFLPVQFKIDNSDRGKRIIGVL